MKISSLTKTGVVADLCEWSGDIGGLAWSSILDGLVFSVPARKEIRFVPTLGGPSESLYQNDAMEDQPTSLAFTPNGESLYIEGASKKSYMGLRIRSLSYFNMLGKRGIEALLHLKTKESPLASSRKNGIAFFEGHLLATHPEGDVVLRIGTNSLVDKYAGTGTRNMGIGSTLLHASFNQPCGITTDKTSAYVCDTGNRMIRKINNGVVSIVGNILPKGESGCPAEITAAFGDSIAYSFADREGIERRNLVTGEISSLYSGQVFALAGNHDYVFMARSS